jgi:predicted transcriptional regulator
MAKHTPIPTDGELEILRAMWRIGRARTLAINVAVNEDRKARSLPALAFNTTATVLGKLDIKGLVHRIADEPTRHEFETIVSEEDVGRAIAGDVVRRLFNGSIVSLVQSAIRDKKPSPKELAGLRTLIDGAAGK